MRAFGTISTTFELLLHLRHDRSFKEQFNCYRHVHFCLLTTPLQRMWPMFIGQKNYSFLKKQLPFLTIKSILAVLCIINSLAGWEVKEQSATKFCSGQFKFPHISTPTEQLIKIYYDASRVHISPLIYLSLGNETQIKQKKKYLQESIQYHATIIKKWKTFETHIPPKSTTIFI